MAAFEIPFVFYSFYDSPPLDCSFCGDAISSTDNAGLTACFREARAASRCRSYHDTFGKPHDHELQWLAAEHGKSLFGGLRVEAPRGVKMHEPMRILGIKDRAYPSAMPRFSPPDAVELEHE